jgi:cytochrome c peroxidase
MTIRIPSLVLFAGLVGVASCKTAEPKPSVDRAAEPSIDAGTAPPPAVVLAEAPPLPARPAGLPDAAAPAENPTTAEKAELGFKLFFDKRLSKDGSMACAACHHLDKAYTSGAALDAKVGGALNKRNAPSMVNLAYHPSFYWDGRMPTLEAVSAAAWKGQLGADPAVVAAALNEVPEYKASFARAFGSSATAETVPQALAAWFRSLQSGNSAWDKAQAGDATAVSPDAKAGSKLFASKGCVTCHVPPLYTDGAFHNLGIGDDAGRRDATKDEADTGKFKTPSLRNVALTGPYFHDGHVATLDEAITLMSAGSKRKGVDPLFKSVKLTAKEKSALKAFLESLTGESTYSTAPALP